MWVKSNEVNRFGSIERTKHSEQSANGGGYRMESIKDVAKVKEILCSSQRKGRFVDCYHVGHTEMTKVDSILQIMFRRKWMAFVSLY